MVTMSIIIAYHMAGRRRRWDVWSPHPGAAAAGCCLHHTPQPDSLLWLTGLFSGRDERWDCPLYVHYLNFLIHPGQLGLP